MNVVKMIATIAVAKASGKTITESFGMGGLLQKWNPHFTPNSLVMFKGS
jgi:hypothetical protein